MRQIVVERSQKRIKESILGTNFAHFGTTEVFDWNLGLQ